MGSDVGPLAPLVAFGRDLRDRGLPVGTGRILTFARAVAALGLTDRESLYWAGRTTMIGRKEDFAAYDEAFADWYAGLITQGELRVELQPADAGRQAAGRLGRAAGRPGGHARRGRGAVALGRRRRARGRRRDVDPDRGERRGGLAREVVPRSHGGRTRAGLGDDPAAGRDRPGRADATDEAGSQGLDVRHPPHAAAVAPNAGRAVRSSQARPQVARPSAGVDPGHQRLDGAVRAGVDAVRVRGDGRGSARGGVRVRDAAHARDADAPHQGPRPRAARDRQAGGRLGGRHQDRRVVEDVCWTGGASVRRSAAPSWSCAPTAWSAAIQSC